MRFLYATDLHGDVQKYEDVFNTALEHRIDLIHLGADLLPKGRDILKSQKRFAKEYLKLFYARCKKEGIAVLASFGNDDIPTRRFYFHQYAQSLDQYPFKKGTYTFIAYNSVPDYPFPLKCACKRDYPGWKFKEEYKGSPIDVNLNGFYAIKDVEGYFKDKGTIEEDLRNMHADKKTIAAIHCPPRSLGLDLCGNGRYVGSKAVLDWIKDKQPLLVLCGHIHESPEFNGGIWKASIGKTLVIQPGQEKDRTTLVLIDIGKKIQAYRLSV